MFDDDSHLFPITNIEKTFSRSRAARLLQMSQCNRPKIQIVSDYEHFFCQSAVYFFAKKKIISIKK